MTDWWLGKILFFWVALNLNLSNEIWFVHYARYTLSWPCRHMSFPVTCHPPLYIPPCHHSSPVTYHPPWHVIPIPCCLWSPIPVLSCKKLLFLNITGSTLCLKKLHKNMFKQKHVKTWIQRYSKNCKNTNKQNVKSLYISGKISTEGVEFFNFFNTLCNLCIVSVLGREEGYTVKYGLSSRDCPRAIPRSQALFYRISQLES